jgi:flagellar hook-basal body complex protein FliE
MIPAIASSVFKPFMPSLNTPTLGSFGGSNPFALSLQSGGQGNSPTVNAQGSLGGAFGLMDSKLEAQNTLWQHRLQGGPQATQGFGLSQPMLGAQGVQGVGAVKHSAFSGVLQNVLGQVNQTVKAPDELLQRSLRGEAVDIHDVALANTKAELAVSLSTQMLTKVVQAYERVSQIQV